MAARVAEYCRALGGRRPINSVLIANNGIAAVKFIRSIRSWAYETFGVERAVLLVAMATPEDMRVNAEHIRMADLFVEVPGGSNNNNYANVHLIAEVAERTGADAVWPGWGHASENPDLPDALAARGIVFLGPPSRAMSALGDKVGSTLIAQAAGVPTLPWSGSAVGMPFDCCSDPIPRDVYRQACVQGPEEAVATCQVIGYPSMIKASWGGGGKGIRKVHNDDEVCALFRQVQGEVPGSPIFIMKVASQSRHLEVQLLCDAYGNVASLHSRDCSVQRRHQKIIEEGPVTVAPPETVKKLERCARRLAKCVGYVGAATVEYLYSEEDGGYYFLELNPRLQVEHPVTEWIAGVNLPAAQLSIGMGIPLWKLPEMRRLYGQEGGGSLDAWQVLAAKPSLWTPFDFELTESAVVKPRGHVVAVRITSEDPDDGFKPTCGRVHELSFKSKPDVWAYFSVKSGGGIHEFSDSQFGHLFAFGESRAASSANMVLALKELHIRGEIRTIVGYCIDLLHTSEYQKNRFHTGWLDSRIAMNVRMERPPWHIAVLAGALHAGHTLALSRISEYISYLEKGQIPPKNLSLVDFKVTLNIDARKYTVHLTKRSPNSYHVQLNSSEVNADIHTLRDGGLLLQVDGNSHVVYAEEEGAGTRLLIDGRTCLLQNDHDPSRLRADTPCKLLRWLVPDGSHVLADTAYAEVEVMKMCMPLLVAASGRIRFRMSEGQSMQAGDLVAVVELDDPSSVRKAMPFAGSLPRLGPPTPVPDKVHRRCAAAVSAARYVLDGYHQPIDEVVTSLLHCLDDPRLPFLQWKECFSVLAARLPKDLKSKLDDLWKDDCEGVGSIMPEEDGVTAAVAAAEFPAKKLKDVLEGYLQDQTPDQRQGQERLLSPLLSLACSYVGGREGHACTIVQSLFEQYLEVEEMFSDQPQPDVIEALRVRHRNHLSKVVDMALSHQGVKHKNKLLLSLMGTLVLPNPAAYREQLLRLAGLTHTSHSEVAMQASQLLEQTKLSELRVAIARSLSELEMFTGDGVDGVHRRVVSIEERMKEWVDAPVAVEDALIALFDHKSKKLQYRAIETYIYRLYQPYLVRGSVRIRQQNTYAIAIWQFWEESAPPPVDVVTGMLYDDDPDDWANEKSVCRWGAMVVASAIRIIPKALDTVLAETYGGWITSLTTAGGSEGRKHSSTNATMPKRVSFVGTPSGFGNVVHLALTRVNSSFKDVQDSGDEGQAEERVSKLAEMLSTSTVGASLHHAGVGVVGCIIRRDEGRSPMRHCFQWSSEHGRFVEDPLLRHVEPPLSNLLALEKLKAMGSTRYASSRDRQWHMYMFAEKARGGVRSFRRMFLRTVLRQPSSLTVDTIHRGPPLKGSVIPSFGQSLGGDRRDDGASDRTVPAPSLERLECVHTHHEERMQRQAEPDEVEIQKLKDGLMRTISGALDELDLTSLDVKLRADHIHLFVSLLRALRPRLLPAEERAEPCPGEGLIDSHADEMNPRDRGTAFGQGMLMTALEKMVRQVDKHLGQRMQRLGVMKWEVRLRVNGTGRTCDGAWRIIVSNPSGYACSIQVYREAVDPKSGEAVYFSASEDCCSTVTAPLHMTPLAAPYKALDALEQKRITAWKNQTTYCYDFPLVFESALQETWMLSGKVADGPLMDASELVLTGTGASDGMSWGAPLAPLPSSRAAGSNDVGMVGWRFCMRSLECPAGREILVVANDVTFQAGAFAPREDAFFKEITEFACQQGLPLVYLAANSGARIGVAEEVRSCFRIGWVEESSPQNGFQYLYVTEEDYVRISSSVIAHKSILPTTGEIRWIIDDIIGAEDGLGVENLSGSGAIAGTFAKAYDTTFTLTFVTGRTVGIGAYLARLGQRCIQRVDQPIILTGFSALNKLLGQEVYTSHMQLGGPKVMSANGVVHLTVENDLQGVQAILRWLSYVPPVRGSSLPIVPSTDPISRLVEYVPETSCDPRAAIQGIVDSFGHWKGGLFDQGSFMETYEAWAQTVVTGRARLGGIPVGVIAVETQTVMHKIPADPAMPDMHETTVPQAGQVWFPNSAAKTAQALQDFNREGLPLFVLANWRGFSGGQRDLFDGVLQAGSHIVEHLSQYRWPGFVYIPRMGELRGGAWVVLDSKINPEMLEMYADSSARAGVLEPEGLVEIKYRPKELIETVHRLDPELIRLDKELKVRSTLPNDRAVLQELQEQIKSRESTLLPMYRQAAVAFAALHDSPKRMLAKGVIQQIVNWEHSRQFFAQRLRFRLKEVSLSHQVLDAAGGTISQREALGYVRRWFAEADASSGPEGQPSPALCVGGGMALETAERFLAWAECGSRFSDSLRSFRKRRAAENVLVLHGQLEGTQGLIDGLKMLLQKANPSERTELSQKLAEVLASTTR
ncbi:hypothetical protein CBR_g21136 [Chara braunii]|uniref:Uncharacterized protein n=1 Tax=Chara braunii TaxID=69332 RepID=A0A388L0P5_CHABU|nr:hypothetical protein CBR_g21136 [Chara braunii]|eukprot:GBG75894.1 hypothetical protein CBR_g21136 [Chara braunii]